MSDEHFSNWSTAIDKLKNERFLFMQINIWQCIVFYTKRRNSKTKVESKISQNLVKSLRRLFSYSLHESMYGILGTMFYPEC